MDKDTPPITKRLTPTCPGKIEVPTEKEREALLTMKSIKERVRKLKGHLAQIKTSCEDEDRKKIGELEKELARLKEDWTRWEEKRKLAAKERMILLGHEERSK